MDKLVLDASVILKLAVAEKEDYFEKAQKIIKNFTSGELEIILPTLWQYEVLNILPRKYSNLSDAIQAFDYLDELDFHTRNLTKKELKTALRLLKKYPKVSFYDTCYHALALTNNATLITSDLKYYQLTKKEGGLKLLKDF